MFDGPEKMNSVIVRSELKPISVSSFVCGTAFRIAFDYGAVASGTLRRFSISNLHSELRFFGNSAADAALMRPLMMTYATGISGE